MSSSPAAGAVAPTASPGAMGGDGAALLARLDRLPSSAAAWRPILLISAGGAFEFYDLMMTGYISPALKRAGLFHDGAASVLGLGDQAVFAAATFVGLFIGAGAVSPVADRFGRRAVFTAALLWYAAATLVMASARTAGWLDAWRLLAGIGIGVELVTIDAYVGEMAPPRLRGRAFAVNQAIQFLAVPVVALACWLLVGRSVLRIAGWRWVMILGAAGALVVWVIRLRLPESPRWLIGHGRIAEARAVVERLEGPAGPGCRVPDEADEPDGSAAIPAATPGPGRLREIFAPPLRRRTIVLVVFNVAQAIGFYGFGNWAPSLIAARGHGVTRSLAYAFAIALAYPVGPLLCAAFADRFERRTQIVAAAILTAALGLAFASQSRPAVLVALGVGLTFSNNLLSFSYHAYQAELFPTRIRARAVGFVYAWSRLSTAASSFVIAGLLGAFGAAGVFVFIAAAMAVVVIAVGAFGPRTLGRSLESLSD